MHYSHLDSDVGQLMTNLGQPPEPVVSPALIVVSGLPGTGKSYFSSKLAQRIPFLVLESDALRKSLFPSPSYSRQESARLFQVTHLLIQRLLVRRIPIILDATNLSERHRERLYNITDRLGAKLVLVRMEAPPEVVRERLKVRQEAANNNSDAGWEVYQKMKPTVEKIRRNHHMVDTSRDIIPVLGKIVREVKR
jgi:predicted kinase